MMKPQLRRLKFRAWSRTYNEWHYGSYSPNGCSRWNRLDAFFEAVIQEDTEAHLDPRTLGQWSGIVDKNGVEIYEGDRVKASNGQYYEIVFLGNIGRFEGKGFHDSHYDYSTVLFSEKQKDNEVVGTMYGIVEDYLYGKQNQTRW